MDQVELQTALANEARRQELRAQIADYTGRVTLASLIASEVSISAEDARRSLQIAKEQLQQLEMGAGPGLTADFGRIGRLDRAARAERAAGDAGAITYIKAHPDCSEEDAKVAYTTAALNSRPQGRKWLLQDPTTLWKERAGNLVQDGEIPDASWESFRAYILLGS